MQTNRLNHLIFPTAPAYAGKTGAPDAASSRPERPSRATPPVLEDVVPQKVPVAGATFTGSAALAEKMAQDKGQVESTKITYSKQSVLATSPSAAGDRSPSQWVDSAVSAMRDFETGNAALKGSAEPGSGAAPANGHAFWSSSLQGIKSAAAKLNVFA